MLLQKKLKLGYALPPAADMLAFKAFDLLVAAPSGTENMRTPRSRSLVGLSASSVRTRAVPIEAIPRSIPKL